LRSADAPGDNPRGLGQKPLLAADLSRSPLEEADAFLAQLREEVGRQRTRAHIGNLTIVGSTVTIPVLLLLSTEYWNFWLGKVAPAILAAVASATALMLQLTKPHERWRLLNVHGGALELERFRYVRRLGDYKDGDADSRLLEQVVITGAAVSDEWSGLMPTSKEAAAKLLGTPE